MTAATKKPRAAGFTKDGTVEATVAFPATVDPFARLKEPFDESMHRQGKMDSEGHTGTYIEWHNVADRIEEVDPLWQHEVTVTYGVVAGQVVCSATASVSILGVTRMGHSSKVVQPNSIGTDGKGNETSAFQRAAAKFGVGRYLYRGGRVEPSFKLTEEQINAIEAEAAKVLKAGDTYSGWASGVLGREVGFLQEAEVTAAELDILLTPRSK